MFEWIDRKNDEDLADANDVNTLAAGIIETQNQIPTKTSDLINDSGYIVSVNNSITEVTTLDSNSLEVNKVFSIIVQSTLTVEPPIPQDTTIQNQILVYLQTTSVNSVYWSSNIVFVNDEIPNVGIGNYRLILEYNPILTKWVAGIIQDGAVS